jgi:Domain of Unknown Function (DUF1080)
LEDRDLKQGVTIKKYQIMKLRIISLLLSLAGISYSNEPLNSRALFNGTDLTGWTGEGYVVEDGAITCTPKGRNLITEETFSNYVLDFEFKLAPGANNGLGIHYPGQGDSAYTGMEIQVLDNTAEKYKDLKPYQFHGSLYTLAPAKKEGLKPVGEWNKQRVVVMGPMLWVELNGQKILDVRLDELSKTHPDHAGVKRRSGHIGWLGHGDKVSYRNIHIAELPSPANSESVKQQGYTPIFDGKSLAGWKHAPETTNWSAINGILKHNGQKGEVNDLWCEKSYKDFILVCDWRWSGRGPMKQQPLVQPDGSQKGSAEIEEFDSGIYLRGNSKSQVNLWNWNVGSGEVYGYRTDKNMPADIRAGVTPTKKADRPIGEWNRMMITLKGDKLSVNLNGQQVIQDAVLPEIPAEGPIGLQHHGSAIDFSNIWIKEL